ncbi:hypothetical protein IID24_05000 [Patescibacteria group bacterium]|nr:hypothetical protein [Patescibacteria group bacterium]
MQKSVAVDLGHEVWHLRTFAMPHPRGFSYPVFQWHFTKEKGPRVGELRAWSLQGLFVFQERRDGSRSILTSVEEANIKVQAYGWGQPPYIEQVFAEMSGLHKNFPTEKLGNLVAVNRAFQDLQDRWMEHVSFTKKSRAELILDHED